MILLEATETEVDVVPSAAGLAVVFRTVHPLSGEIVDSIAVRLSIHKALALSEQLRRCVETAIRSDEKTVGARVLRMSSP